MVPVKLSHQTEFQGMEKLEQQAHQEGTGGAGQQDKQKAKQGDFRKMAKKLQPGDKVSIEVKTERGQNKAQKVELTESTQRQQQLQGEVASAKGNWINVQHEGALIPLKVDKDTQFEGINGVRQLKQGTQIQAEFRIESRTDNVATRIQAQEQGTGGSFEQGQKQQEQFEDPATGGSFEEGLEQQDAVETGGDEGGLLQ